MSPRLLTSLICVFSLATLAVAQSPEPQLLHRPADPVPTLKARAKLVIVDVVVEGPRRTPIQGLKRADFTLAEDKHAQTLKGFEEHTALSPAEALKFPPMPTMPPGIFTNFTPTPVNSAVNVVLLDALNTPIADQAYVRSQMLDYIKKERPGTSVAIFGLGTQLHLLQGFTSNPAVLRAVMTKQSYAASPLLDDPTGGGAVPDAADQLASFGSPSSGQVAAGLANMASIQQSFQLQLRAKYTLDAFNVLARYLANIPGRKNLIWFSGSFPLDILPDGDAADPFLAVADSEAEYRETTNLLTRAQVSVYPVDARGLQTLPMFSASASGSKYARNPRALGQDSAKFFQSQALEHDTMTRMAEDRRRSILQHQRPGSGCLEGDRHRLQLLHAGLHAHQRYVEGRLSQDRNHPAARAQAAGLYARLSSRLLCRRPRFRHQRGCPARTHRCSSTSPATARTRRPAHARDDAGHGPRSAGAHANSLQGPRPSSLHHH